MVLTKCPQCYSKLQADENAIQVCKMCGYLTKSGTVIIEPLELYDSVIIYEWEGEDD